MYCTVLPLMVRVMAKYGASTTPAVEVLSVTVQTEVKMPSVVLWCAQPVNSCSLRKVSDSKMPSLRTAQTMKKGDSAHAHLCQVVAIEEMRGY